jgi:hypothetical protein
MGAPTITPQAATQNNDTLVTFKNGDTTQTAFFCYRRTTPRRRAGTVQVGHSSGAAGIVSGGLLSQRSDDPGDVHDRPGRGVRLQRRQDRHRPEATPVTYILVAGTHGLALRVERSASVRDPVLDRDQRHHRSTTRSASTVPSARRPPRSSRPRAAPVPTSRRTRSTGAGAGGTVNVVACKNNLHDARHTRHRDLHLYAIAAPTFKFRTGTYAMTSSPAERRRSSLSLSHRQRSCVGSGAGCGGTATPAPAAARWCERPSPTPRATAGSSAPVHRRRSPRHR